MFRTQNEISFCVDYWKTSLSIEENLRKEILALASNQEELSERFYRDLEFGTGGMRGIMGAGTSRLNLPNIRKASTAVASYLKKVYGHTKQKIVITYDSRNNSKEFAEESARTFCAHGIETFITAQMRPVPFLSFLVKKLNAHAGICITASHNPPEYNGYKVYWGTGGQLVPPHDKGITLEFSAITSYDGLKTLDLKEAKTQNLFFEISEKYDEIYLEKLASLCEGFDHKRELKIVYTPIHGTGIFLLPQALKKLGYNDVHIVESQSVPNGNFPTVKSPNPEEEEALELALDLGKKLNADIVLGTDPDADRIGVIVREGNEWLRFNGNQLGCLLTEFLLFRYKALGRLPSNSIVIKTIVTTELQRDIASHYGLACEDTLTGFKWIGDRIVNYENSGEKHFICGGEESYGFLAGDFVKDKDAIIGATIACEMLSFYKSIGKSLSQLLDELFLRHGVYKEHLVTFTLPGKEGALRIQEIMAKMRKTTPKFSNKVGQIIECIDYLASTGLPKSDVLQFKTDQNLLISIRPSGTEPKVKVYFSAHQKLSPAEIADENLVAAKNKLDQLLVEAEQEMRAHLS